MVTALLLYYQPYRGTHSVSHLRSKEGTTIKAEAYYSAQVDGTIISPTTLVRQNSTIYSGWIHHANCDDNKGYISLIPRTSDEHATLPVECHNDLWYHITDSIQGSTTPQISKLSNASRYELWHQRLAHPGTKQMELIHQHTKGIPQLKGNPFYRCPACMSGKLCIKRPIGKTQPKTIGSTGWGHRAAGRRNRN